MGYHQDIQEPVSITFSVDDWAKIVASIGFSQLTLAEKDQLNSHIFDCVKATQRTLS